MIHKGLEMVSSDNIQEKFFNRKYWEWQAGDRRSQKEFAVYLGVEPGTLSHWMNGVRKPDYESCIMLSKKLGNAIFIVGGFIPPDPALGEIVSVWDDLNEEAKSSITAVVKDSDNKNSRSQDGPAD